MTADEYENMADYEEHMAALGDPDMDRPPVSGEPSCRCCGPNADCTCRRPGYHQYPHKDFCAVNLPPVSGEPRDERAPGLGVTFATGMTRAFSDDDVLALLRRVEAEAIRRNLARASTGAALDALDLVDIIEQAIFETDTGLAAALLADERIRARLAEQEGDR